jgi:cytochrome c
MMHVSVRVFVSSLSLAAIGFAAPSVADDRQLRKEARALTKPCKACHDLRREKRKFGPYLVGVVGWPVASVERYKYSDALKALGGVWTEERIATFINNPAAYAPGTNMKFKGFNDMTKARLAAAYLARKSSR